MDTREKRKQLQALAEDVFELSKLGSRARAQARSGDSVDTLTETETLTLDLLSKHDSLTVGEIQREIGVLPAQMSRIVRSLEDKSSGPYIECNINPEDRRKVDVSITSEGRKVLEAYREERLGAAVRLLAVLTQTERDEFANILNKIRDHLQAGLRKD